MREIIVFLSLNVNKKTLQKGGDLMRYMDCARA